MRLIDTIWDSKYAKLWIAHTVAVKWDKVLSYTMDWLFSKWVVSIHTKKEWETTFHTVVSDDYIPDINIMKYEDLELDGLTCFEAIEYIYHLEWVKMNTGRLKTYLILWFIQMFVIMISIIVWIWIWIALDDDQVAMIEANYPIISY